MLSLKGNSVTGKRKPRPHSQEIELPGQSFGHSQELVDVEEEETTRAGGGVNAVRNSQSPSMFSTPDIEEVNSLQVGEMGCFICYLYTLCRRFIIGLPQWGLIFQWIGL